MQASFNFNPTGGDSQHSSTGIEVSSDLHPPFTRSSPPPISPPLLPEESQGHSPPSPASHFERAREHGQHRSIKQPSTVIPTTVWQVQERGGERTGINTYIQHILRWAGPPATERNPTFALPGLPCDGCYIYPHCWLGRGVGCVGWSRSLPA
jgi:hypothetical protein